MSKAAFRKSNGFGAIAVLLLFGSSLVAEELSLDQAIQLALQHNVEIANAALDVSKAKDRSAAFRTSLFPKLSTYMLGSEQLKSVDITISQGTLVPLHSVPARSRQEKQS
jgi:hypothetical protein